MRYDQQTHTPSRHRYTNTASKHKPEEAGSKKWRIPHYKDKSLSTTGGTYAQMNAQETTPRKSKNGEAVFVNFTVEKTRTSPGSVTKLQRSNTAPIVLPTKQKKNKMFKFFSSSEPTDLQQPQVHQAHHVAHVSQHSHQPQLLPTDPLLPQSKRQYDEFLKYADSMPTDIDLLKKNFKADPVDSSTEGEEEDAAVAFNKIFSGRKRANTVSSTSSLQLPSLARTMSTNSVSSMRYSPVRSGSPARPRSNSRRSTSRLSRDMSTMYVTTPPIYNVVTPPVFTDAGTYLDTKAKTHKKFQESISNQYSPELFSGATTNFQSPEEMVQEPIVPVNFQFDPVYSLPFGSESTIHHVEFPDIKTELAPELGFEQFLQSDELSQSLVDQEFNEQMLKDVNQIADSFNLEAL